MFYIHILKRSSFSSLKLIYFITRYCPVLRHTSKDTRTRYNIFHLFTYNRYYVLHPKMAVVRNDDAATTSSEDSFSLFGATAPLGPGPLHTRGF